MKFHLFTLFVTFITQVHAFEIFKCYEQKSRKFPNTCQELFKTEQCNNCQSLMWDRFNNPNQCGTLFNFAQEISKVVKDENLKYKHVKKGLENYCQKDFQCDQQKVEKIIIEIQNECGEELSFKLDWGVNPKNFDRTSYVAYIALIDYYHGNLGHKALCAKNNLGDFHIYEFSKKYIKWVMEKTHCDLNATVSYSIQHVYKGDGEKIDVPKSIFCDPNWRKMAQFYIDYIKEHGINDSIKNWGPFPNFKKTYLPDCTYHKRGLGEIMKKGTKLFGFSWGL